MDDNEHLRRELSRLTKQNDILCATTTSSIHDSDSSSPGLSSPTSSINMTVASSLTFPILETSSLWSRNSESFAAIDLEPSSRVISREFSESFSSAVPFTIPDSATNINPIVTQKDQQQLHGACPMPHYQTPVIDPMDESSFRQTTEIRSSSPPLETRSSSSVGNFKKSSSTQPVGSRESPRAQPSKRKREYIEYMFGLKSTEHSDGEQQVKRGRRGRMSTATCARQKEVKSVGGACWRCRILKQAVRGANPWSLRYPTRYSAMTRTNVPTVNQAIPKPLFGQRLAVKGVL